GNSTTSSVALLSVSDPIITSQPLGLTNIAGTTAVLSVGAAGSPTLNYQWKKGPVNVVDGGNVAGANTATLTITNINQTNAGNYSVLVGSGSGSNVNSATVTLAVIDPIVITAQPVSRTILTGSRVAFVIGLT